MRTETVQRGCAQDVVPNFEELMTLTEDREQGPILEQEITRNREIQSRQDKRDAQRTKRSVQDPLSRRWSRCLNLDESFRALFHFTWRC